MPPTLSSPQTTGSTKEANTTTSPIGQRKTDHLDLCATDRVAFRDRTNLLDNVRLVHQSLPDLSLDEVDTRVELLGKTLSAPIVIAAMTGGTDRASEVNRTLAAIANERGYGFGLGSQRAMQKDPTTSWTFNVRQWAPDALIMGNIGVVQARACETAALSDLVQSIGADALCVHLNPAMELVQPEGDRDFRDGKATIARLVEQLPVPVVAKETGNGISFQTARALQNAGVRTVDVSGAGGTSWVGVEALRADKATRHLGEILWDWGVPTAASVHYAVKAGLQTIATGGLRTGYDIARALALGATAGGIARHVFQAYETGGRAGAERFLSQVETEIRAIMLLCGARDVASMQRAPKIIHGELQSWISQATTLPYQGASRP